VLAGAFGASHQTLEDLAGHVLLWAACGSRAGHIGQ
jgi:hypothetical protein